MSRWRSKLSEREEGFTLVELVVAMVIIGVVMVSLITVQVRTLQTNATSSARITATALANEAMEEFRALPWNVLRKGMASNYLTASGGDSLVSGGYLSVQGSSFALTVAPSGPSDQNLAAAWPPLFDSTGSNRRTVTDAEGNGNVYVVKAYVTANSAGATGAIGLAVVVEWSRPGGAPMNRTVLFSTAYAPGGGCGNLDVAPFLTSCQPTYRASANAASVNAIVGSYSFDPDTGVTGGQRTVLPGDTSASISASAAVARASVDSAQSSVTSASVEYPLSSISPMSAAGTASLFGGGSLVRQASNNPVDPNAPPLHGGFVSGTGTSSVASVNGTATVTVRGDDGRSGTVTASTTNSCNTPNGGFVPAGQPCAVATTNATGVNSMGATWTYVGAAGPRSLSLVSLAPTASKLSGAWAGRFVQGGATGVAGTTGCSALTGAGCVSAGATSFVPTVTIGKFDGSGWNGGQASTGLVTITNYKDNVLLERGGAQQANPPVYDRTATVRYWNGTGYTQKSVTKTTTATWASAQVTWSAADMTVVAQATVSVMPANSRESGSDCAVDRCRVQLDTGLISVTTRFTVIPIVGEAYVLESVVLLNGANALAQYTEPADV